MDEPATNNEYGNGAQCLEAKRDQGKSDMLSERDNGEWLLLLGEGSLRMASYTVAQLFGDCLETNRMMGSQYKLRPTDPARGIDLVRIGVALIILMHPLHGFSMRRIFRVLAGSSVHWATRLACNWRGRCCWFKRPAASL